MRSDRKRTLRSQMVWQEFVLLGSVGFLFAYTLWPVLRLILAALS